MRRLVLVNDEAFGIFQGVDESQVFFATMTNSAVERASAPIMVPVTTVADVMPVRG